MSSPPADLDMERAALGAVLARPEGWPTLAALAGSGDFYAAKHAELYLAMGRVAEAGGQPDVTMVAHELSRFGGDPMLVRDVEASCPLPANVATYAAAVARLANQRRLLAAAARAMAAAAADGDEPVVLAAAAADQMMEAVQAAAVGSALVGELIAAGLQTVEGRYRNEADGSVHTGFRDLDELVVGMLPGQLMLVAARPGVGKTAFASNVAVQVAGAGHPVLFFSLEMSGFEVSMRMLCSEAAVPFAAVRAGGASVGQWRELMRAENDMAGLPLRIADGGNLRVPQMRVMARQHPEVELVVVDYLQLMSGTGTRQNRQEEVAEISRSLKMLAKELNVPVLACCQLNRESDRRQDKRPQLSDLRESGSLEQDADLVVMLHRGEDETEAELIVAKHRNGPTGSVKLRFDRQFTRFRDRLY